MVYETATICVAELDIYMPKVGILVIVIWGMTLFYKDSGMGHCPNEATVESQMPPRCELGSQLGQAIPEKPQPQINYGNLNKRRYVSRCFLDNRFLLVASRAWPTDRWVGGIVANPASI